MKNHCPVLEYKLKKLMGKEKTYNSSKSQKRIIYRCLDKQKKVKEKYNIILIMFITIFSIGFIGMNIISIMTRVESKQLKELARITEQHTNNQNTELRDNLMLLKYYELYNKNSDLYGWIKISGTEINYPVMYTPECPEKYLRRDFDGNYSYCGLPFIDSDCDEYSDNMLIYGHNMIEKKMFTELINYNRESYWKEHPVINFDTLYEENEYEVVFAFYDKVYTTEDDVFKIYNFINAENQQEFNNAINTMETKKLYDTGIKVEYGDKLLTLITCGYHTENGRFIVVARKK